MSNFESVFPLIQACVSNAESLPGSAKELRRPERNHIAYHLAALALEEIGKASMLIAQSSRHLVGGEDVDEVEDVGLSKWFEDHERKLFWALWTPSFAAGQFGVDEFRELQAVAKDIHEKRLATLYVNVIESPAQREVSEEDLTLLIGLAEARLGMEKLVKLREIGLAERRAIRWFFDGLEDPQLKGMFLSQSSLSKLAEFTGDSSKWLTWLQEQVGSISAQSRELLENELRRNVKNQRGAHKWQIKMRFHSLSHSIRPKQLGSWNKQSEWIKLFPTAEKDELLVQFTLASQVSIHDLWQAGLQMSTMFLISLNVATVGYSWWYLPDFVSRYYEELMDLETRSPIAIERNPPLTLSWVRHALKEAQLQNAGVVLIHLIGLSGERVAAYGRYNRGLALLAKNDIFGQFEPTILNEFFEAFRTGLTGYGDWDGSMGTFPDARDKVLAHIWSDPETRDHIKSIVELAAEIAPQAGAATRPITLDEVFKMKACCDIYFFSQARRELQERKKQESSPAENDA